MATTKANSQRLASWIFGGIALAFLIGVFIFGPDELPVQKHRILGIMSAVLAGLFGYFFTGSMKIVTEGRLPGWGKVTIQASGGAALFVLVLLWWGSDYAPIGLQEKVDGILNKTFEIDRRTSNIEQNVAQIVEMLREELSIKNRQIGFLQGETVKLREITPSERALELAQKIPEDAGSYALALKAIAERRFDDARRLLDEAQQQKETELSEIYRARGETESYAGNYRGAVSWYEKSLELSPDDPGILNDTGFAFLECAKYSEAEPLMWRALEIHEKSFGKDHPSVAIDLNNLAQLLKATNRPKEAEPLYRRALEIDEKSFGKDHPSVARDLNNLAMLLKDTNRLKEAEPLMRQVVKILENPGDDPFPNYAGALNNLAQLFHATNRLKEAEPLMRRALEIDEKSFGKDHPTVAIRLNNLALLFGDTNRLKEAEPLMKRALDIFEKSLGPDHPNTQIARENLEILKERISRR